MVLGLRARLGRLVAVLIVLALLGLGAARASVSHAQTICEGPECDVTDTCERTTCPPNPGDEDSDSSPGNVDYEGGCSVTTTPEEGDGAICVYYCHDDRMGFIFDASLGVWLVDEASSEINGESDFSSIDGVPICSWSLADQPPCTSITINPGGEISCGGDYSVTASAQVPCMTVLRDPYPRGIVSAPNDFWLNGPWSAVGSASSRAWCTPKIKNYTLRVGWQFYPAVPPTWFFDDRAWSKGGQYAYGMAVTHTYETSSWDLPANGPSLNGVYELPAYQVRVGTAWQAIVRRTWEELERGDRKTFTCQDGDTQCLDLYAMCDTPGTDPENDSCYVWNWVPHDTGWVPLDLTLYGYAHPYYVSSAAGDVTMPPPGVLAVPLGHRVCSVPVPVIESQALLNSPADAP